MTDARILIEYWRQEFNSERPHSSLGNRTPEEFARSVSIKRLEEAVFQNRMVRGTQASHSSEHARLMGERSESLCVRDLMSEELVTVTAGPSIVEVARALATRRIHRILVVDDRRLVGNDGRKSLRLARTHDSVAATLGILLPKSILLPRWRPFA